MQLDIVVKQDENIKTKVPSLDSVLKDTEKRLDTLSSANAGLKKTELSLHELNREINRKFDILRDMTKENLNKSGSNKDTGISPSERETIKSLKRQGWTVQEIASRFNRTTTEIDLILDLPE